MIEALLLLLLAGTGCRNASPPVRSPDGLRSAYFTNTTVDEPQCPTEVVILSAEGTRLRSIPALDRGNAVMRIDWLGNRRIGIDTHVNPSLGQYRVVDVTTGKELAAYLGHSFRPSPGSRRIAYAGWKPHFAPPFAKSGYLLVDGRIVYPPGVKNEPNLRPADSVDKILFRDILEFRSDSRGRRTGCKSLLWSGCSIGELTVSGLTTAGTKMSGGGW